jgi:hypothetical protein
MSWLWAASLFVAMALGVNLGVILMALIRVSDRS